MVSGARKEALDILSEAISISRKVGMSFVGPRLLGTFSVCSIDEDARKAALKEGSQILKSGCHAHNRLWFLRDAIESSLISDNRELVLKYSDWLEKITEKEPLPWSKYFIERGRAIVRLRSAPDDGENKQKIIHLMKVAKNVGFSSHEMT